jgi:hypothetical protein
MRNMAFFLNFRVHFDTNKSGIKEQEVVLFNFFPFFFWLYCTGMVCQNTVNSHLKAHAPVLCGTLYRRMQPTVIFSFFVTGAMRYRFINLPFQLHQRAQYHSHSRYHQFYLFNDNRNATVVQR